MITSVNSLYLLYAPVVTMVINVSSHVLALCMVKSVIGSVCVVLIVNAHRSMDHVTAIQDILDQPAVQVCNVQSIHSLDSAHQLKFYYNVKVQIYMVF